MSEQQHTPEPWNVHMSENATGILIEGANEECVIGGCGCCGSPWGDNKFDVPRLVRCVNACASIPNYQLTGEGGEPTNLAGVIDELRKQRDELKAACETYMTYGVGEITYYRIRAALDFVKGGAE